MSFAIRSMAADEIGLALDWAAAEGWNPGIADAACFYAADPGAFLVATLDEAPIGCISATDYGAAFGFIGFYLMRPAFRGKGYGMALWRAAMARLQGRVIGLDGVVAQQANYRKSGFTLLHRNIRFGAAAPLMPALPGPQPIEATAQHFQQIAAFDRRFFPSARDAFLRQWLTAPGHVALALMGAGGVQALGVLRPCREGSKIGPLFAETPEAARGVFAACLPGRRQVRFFWMYLNRILTRLRWRRKPAWRPPLKPRACMPGPRRTCPWRKSTASPASNWAETHHGCTVRCSFSIAKPSRRAIATAAA